MKLKSLLLRYYPPGILLEYEKSGELRTKSIDLLELSSSTDVGALVEEIQKVEPLITTSRTQQVTLLVQRLQEKLAQHSDHSFYLFKVLRAHILPLTNVALNKSGSCFITGSYDRTCKVWDTTSGEELHTLEGHGNVVYTIAFNNPYGKMYTLIGHSAEISSAMFNWDSSLILTGSVDKTCMLWDATNGKCVTTLTDHDDEVLDSCFDYTGKLIATASADGTARIYCTATRKCIIKLEGHEGEISKISFNPQGTRLLTGSSDKTARIWDVQTGQCLQVLKGHTDEIFSCAFNYKGNLVITGSKDNTCRIWR
ncbi:dynein assembly factor with WDR repeat domains 1 isoform X4 [Perognathus longimembris pacificus]|uniref:dynein assembly factor with WDR repeat domains 1 isoform X4 n=1 Tax=Perognathus longimembris pacificus TaxID=214514 RepID=UPI002019423B|nr:dynein assembly factor with WDR repeat domains 1 isoform X4 [Perognathus longimembris pacificus]